jgi:hypothetical protein
MMWLRAYVWCGLIWGTINGWPLFKPGIVGTKLRERIAEDPRRLAGFAVAYVFWWLSVILHIVLWLLPDSHPFVRKFVRAFRKEFVDGHRHRVLHGQPIHLNYNDLCLATAFVRATSRDDARVLTPGVDDLSTCSMSVACMMPKGHRTDHSNRDPRYAASDQGLIVAWRHNQSVCTAHTCHVCNLSEHHDGDHADHDGYTWPNPDPDPTEVGMTLPKEEPS